MDKTRASDDEIASVLLLGGDRGATEAYLYARGRSPREVFRATTPDSKRVQSFVRAGNTAGARVYLGEFGISRGRVDGELQAAAEAILKQDRPASWLRGQMRRLLVLVVLAVVAGMAAPYLEAFVGRWL